MNKHNQRATLPAHPGEEGRNYSGKKELTDEWQLVCYEKGKGLTCPITIRCWMGRSRNASTVYASIWISRDGFYAAGWGDAGGWGYCKASAAVGDAISRAGIVLERDIHGAGHSAIKEAMHAIADALGCGKMRIIV